MLTGLQFVIVALSADLKIGTGADTEVFATPTIIHFCSVLLIAAILSVPRQTAATLALCLALEGLTGLLYATAVAVRIARQKTRYVPVLEDRIWHVALPLFAYGTLFASVSVYWHEVGALYVIAATAILLLLIGIHNAWDAAVYISMAKRGE